MNKNESFASVVSPAFLQESERDGTQPLIVEPFSADEDSMTSRRTSSTKKAEEGNELRISFNCRTISGAVYPLKDVSYLTTVLEVKEKICEQSGMKPNQIRLIYKGRPLKDPNETVGQVSIQDNGVVYIIINLTIDKEDAEKHGVKVEIKQTAPSNENLVRFRVPVGGPGNHVQVTTQAGVQVRAFIPPNHNVGDLMEFRIPPTTAPVPAQTQQRTQPPRPHRMNNIGPPAVPRAPQPRAPTTRTAGTNTMMKVVCPLDARPGDKIQMMVPGHGRMRVTVPAHARPGEQFYFKV